jgi:membrane protease YdiL (CAAX protease family)
VNRVRLACWTGLVGAITAVNYAARFSSSSKTTPAGNEVYSWSQFVGGMFFYAVWLGIILAIAVDRFDLLALRRPRSWFGAARLAGLAIVTVYVFELLVSLIPLPESPGKEQGLTPSHWEPSHAGAFAANLALFTLAAPLVEELAFRGLGQSLLRFLGRWPSILLVGLAFGVAHGLVEGLIVLIPFGVALAYVRDRTGSVVPGMVVHGLFNGVALAYSVLS